VTNRNQVSDAVHWAKSKNLPYMMIGGGSNIFWRDEGYPGLVLVNQIMHYEDFAEDELNHYLTVGAGENWDSVVERSVQAGLTGIECLSLVPGTAGGTPVQNVGAYGQEVANTLVSVEVFDTQIHNFLNIPSQDCAFGYRTSRFKTTDKGRFLITGMTFHLLAGNPEPPYYAALQAYLNDNKITHVTPAVAREAVIAIRTAKLPDPAKVANNGSFFANPVISELDYASLVNDKELEIPHWEQPDGMVKIPAAWLVEQAGFKDLHDAETGMATWQNQPLVLVNEKAKSTADLLKFRNKIITAVQQNFNITLQQEPELLP
jgi:UDP-N-acetylmuramate dehydrogenase